MKILICSIIRNQEDKLQRWYNQIKDVVTEHSDKEFYLSVYENDSTDNTKEILKSFDYSIFKNSSIISENLPDRPKFFKGGYDPYGEESRVRVKLLSECRNKSLLAKNFYKKVDYVLFIEPDIVFNKDVFTILFNEINYNKFDVLSCVSRNSDGSHYDQWGTRFNKGEKWATITNQKGIQPIYSTFNCFTFYNADAIKNGVKFGYESKVLNSHDCDTVVVCENMREMNYNKIYIHYDLSVTHHF